MLLRLHFDCFSILIVSFGHTIVWFLLFIGSFKQAKIPSLLALKILIIHFSSQNATLCLKKWLHFDIAAIERTLVVSFFIPAAFIYILKGIDPKLENFSFMIPSWTNYHTWPQCHVIKSYCCSLLPLELVITHVVKSPKIWFWDYRLRDCK